MPKKPKPIVITPEPLEPTIRDAVMKYVAERFSKADMNDLMNGRGPILVADEHELHELAVRKAAARQRRADDDVKSLGGPPEPQAPRLPETRAARPEQLSIAGADRMRRDLLGVGENRRYVRGHFKADSEGKVSELDVYRDCMHRLKESPRKYAVRNAGQDSSMCRFCGEQPIVVNKTGECKLCLGRRMTAPAEQTR